MKQDLRFALRTIARRRWYSAAVIVILALGIGANTTVFTLVNALMFKPLPIEGAGRLVVVSAQDLNEPAYLQRVSLPDLRDFRAETRSFAALEAYVLTRAALTDQGNPAEQLFVCRVTPGLFGALHTPPVLGRDFSPADAKAGAEGVALLSWGVWQSRYGGAADVIGRVVRIEGQPVTIVGVMPEGFKFPNFAEVWVPLVENAELEKRSSRSLRVIGLLQRETSIAAAGAHLAAIAQRLAQEFPETNRNITARVQSFHEASTPGPIRAAFWAMLAAVSFVLLIACANVANLTLSQAIARRREFTVRAAVGASRWQLVRQQLVESLVLSCVGGLLGLILSFFGVRAVDLATQDVGKPYWIQFSMDYAVFAYLAVVSVLSAVLFGLVPALRASRIDLNTALKDDATAASSHRGGKLTSALVVVQFALTVVLLTGAGLMVRSVLAAQSSNSFIPADKIFTILVGFPDGRNSRYAGPAERLRFYDELLPRLAAIPGVTHAAAGSHLPGAGARRRQIEIEGRPVEQTANPLHVSVLVYSPDYAAAIGLPILHGRGFHARDGDTGSEAAVVTRAFAAKFWPNQPVLGTRFRFFDNRTKTGGAWMTVIGVSEDMVQSGEEAVDPPLVFVPLRQEPTAVAALLVRTWADSAALAPLVRAAVRDIDQDLPLFDGLPLRGALLRRQWQFRMFGTLFLTFAAIALLIASLGLYAVVAQTAARRTREIGIRIALGASAGQIARLVISRGLIQLGFGMMLGLAGAFAMTRLLVRMRLLFRISPHDALTFTTVTALLIIIGLAACWLPSRRAARIDPVEALRFE